MFEDGLAVDRGRVWFAHFRVVRLAPDRIGRRGDRLGRSWTTQQAFGLSTPTNGNGGMPDVAALSSGDTYYAVLSADYVNGTSTTLLHGDGGTSAAAPLWASLTTQFNAIFVDQGCPSSATTMTCSTSPR